MENIVSNNEVEFNNNENDFIRTKFLVSVGYLVIQVLLPALVLFFLTGTDFTFTFKEPLWLMIVLTISLIVFTFIATLIAYKMKLHQIDQFTYAIPFAFVLGMLYISGYFLTPDQLLIRFIISIAGAVIGILLTSIVLVLVIRKTQIKKYPKI
ncbi:DxFTY motif-containing membrane protein [Spiroplasma endosymbiont of Virgichneumon dumeticola]|uniref:DxFTY motif-containing membrane protein n=1 Tax=Spiroplasma endosymbiont of Virgichneumon dumeticola TaxID=3139323 RepID=UPI0035C8C3BD